MTWNLSSVRSSMAKKSHISVFEAGAAAVNSWKRMHPDEVFDLSGLDLSDRSLGALDLSDANLTNTNLIGCDLRGVTLDRANLQNADLTASDLRSASLRKVNLSGSKVELCNCDHANFTEASMSSCSMKGASLRFSDFTDADLSRSCLDSVQAQGIVIRRAKIPFCSFEKSQMSGGNFTGVLAQASIFTGADLRSSKLEGAEFSSSSFSHTRLEGASLSCSDLRGCRFESALMSDAILDGAVLDSGTRFDNSILDGATIHRNAIACLEENDTGGLTVGMLTRMNIIDDLLVLKMVYSGFWFWVHMVAFVMFLAPYIFFSLRLALLSEIEPSNSGSLRVWEAILRYIWSGGNEWRDGWHAEPVMITCFLISLLYNVLRFLLVWKTKELELKEKASGLLVDFRLEGWWKVAHTGGRFGFFLNVVVVAIHTFHFLNRTVPNTALLIGS